MGIAHCITKHDYYQVQGNLEIHYGNHSLCLYHTVYDYTYDIEQHLIYSTAYLALL